jgi:hypothetical protein
VHNKFRNINGKNKKNSYKQKSGGIKMSLNIKKTAAGLVFACAVLVFNLNCFGYIHANKAGDGYGGGEGFAAESGPTIEELIVQGGASYLEASNNVQDVLRLVELQDSGEFDFDRLNMALDNALVSITGAIDTYGALITKAEATPYNEAFIAKLKAMDYDQFRVMNGLNKVIFKSVSVYLKNGDITGLFREAHGGFIEIKSKMKIIKTSVSSNTLPEISRFWELNESFAQMSLLGSYAARIFDTIK